MSEPIYTVSIGTKGATVMPENDFNHPLAFSFHWPEHHSELADKGNEIAHFIRAAPALFEACRRLCHRLEVNELVNRPGNPCNHYDQPDYDFAKQAMAAALGEESLPSWPEPKRTEFVADKAEAESRH
jgi:hypothetical protein